MKYIYIYICIYIYIFFFFDGFPVAKMKKKKEMNEKKKKRKSSCRLLLGYCPFVACTGSRYNSCIVTQRLGRLAWAQPGGHDMASHAHDTAGEGLQYGREEAPRHDARSCDTRGTARARARTAQRRYSTGGGGGGCDTAAYACDTAEREACDTAKRGACDTAGPGLRQGAGCAQGGPRLGALCTRPSFDLVHCLNHCS